MASKNRINELYENFQLSTFALHAYITQVDHFLQDNHIQTESLFAKIKKIRAGEILETNQNDTIKLELTEGEFATLGNILEEMSTITSQHPNMLLEMGYIYLIALFDAYLTDIWTTVLVSKPEMLKSKSKQLNYEKIIELSEEGSLLSYLANREINELSYKSISEQNNFYKSKFGIDLEDSGISLKILTELRVNRNILVHNKGVVNHMFLELIPNTGYSLGDKILLSFQDWVKALKHLRQVAKYLKNILLEKFYRN